MALDGPPFNTFVLRAQFSTKSLSSSYHPRREPILGVNISLPYFLTRAAYGKACGNILYSFPCIEFLNKYGTTKDLIVKTLNLFAYHILLSLPVENKWHVNIFRISQ